MFVLGLVVSVPGSVVSVPGSTVFVPGVVDDSEPLGAESALHEHNARIIVSNRMVEINLRIVFTPYIYHSLMKSSINSKT